MLFWTLKTKIEFTVIKNLEFVYIKTLYANEVLMEGIVDLSKIVDQYQMTIKKNWC